MARTKLTPRKRTIVMPTRRTRFTLGKRIPTHLVEALWSMEEESLVEVPMEEPLEDMMEDEPMDEETEEGPMFEEPIEIEESGEEPMEENGQGGQDGPGDPNDGDDFDNSDSDDGGDGGDGNGDDGGDGDGDGGNDGNGGDDDHDALLAQEWTTEIHYDLEGDAYYHPKLLSLIRRYHTRCTV